MDETVYSELDSSLRRKGFSEEDIAIVRSSTELERAVAYIYAVRGQVSVSQQPPSLPAVISKQVEEAPTLISDALATVLLEYGFERSDVERCVKSGHCIDIDQAVAYLTDPHSEEKMKDGSTEKGSNADIKPCSYDNDKAPSDGWMRAIDDSTLYATLLEMGYADRLCQAALKCEQCIDIDTAVSFILRTLHEESTANAAVPRQLQAFNSDNCRRLLSMGFNADEIADALEQGDNINDALLLINGEGKECAICLAKYLVENMYSINCPCTHRLCFTCISTHVRLALINTESQQMHIPACPCQTLEAPCPYLITPGEIEQIINIGGTPEVDLFDRQMVTMLHKNAAAVYLDKAKRDMGCIQCPKCSSSDEGGGGEYWFIPPDSDNVLKLLIRCPRCDVDFCCVCHATPYHYNCECDEMAGHTQNYLRWVSSGRREYAEERARRDATYQAQLTAYDSEREKHEEEIQAANARMKEVEDSEDWKAVNCKRCPHCSRIIQKLSGCDAMKCGQNYHGGDIQNGCGFKFNWSSQQAYKAEANASVHISQPGEFGKDMPENALSVQHELAPGSPLLCDDCLEPIVGIRIRCLNCPSFNQCFNCNMAVTHAGNTHVFELLKENAIV